MRNQLSVYLIALLLQLVVTGISSHVIASDLATPTLSPELNEPYQVTEFTIDGPGVLKVFTLAGNIDVLPSDDEDKVRIELFVNRGYAFWSNNRNLDNYRITSLQRGNEIVASVEEKSKDTGLFSDQMTFSYKVYVPRQMSAELKTFGGHISLKGISGNHMMRTSGGNITIEESTGKITAFTAGGHIRFNDLRGTVFAQSEGGDITGKDIAGEIRLKVKGGNTDVSHISGTMLVQSDGGNIRASFEDVGQGINLATSAGNIDLSIPENLDYTLSATGSDVQLNRSFSFEGSRNNRSISGNIGSGGIPVTVSTGAGEIVINGD